MAEVPPSVSAQRQVFPRLRKTQRFANWGIYLVDIFDNMLLLAEQPGYALFEPIPFRKAAKPPVIPDKVNLASKDATLILDDIYDGPGLAGVPRGTVKKLRSIFV